MQYWLAAGLNYIQYSAICARVLRRCVLENVRKDATKREESYAKINKWVDGKVVQTVNKA